MSKILAIDDRQDNLVAVTALLKTFISDCRVLTAQSGAEGLRMADSEQPDVILLDVKMPGMDGFEVCRRIKTDDRTRHIPVIMISAVRTESRDLVKGLETGADAYLPKPIDEFVLTAQVRSALRIRAAEYKLRQQNAELDRLVKLRTQSLHESQQRVNALLNAPSDMAILIDTDFRIQAINSVAARHLGKPVDQLMNSRITDWHPLEIGQKRMAMARQAIQTGQPLSFEDERNGKMFFHRVYPIMDSHGQVVQLALYIRDITEKRKIETQKRHLENQLRQSQKMEAIGNLAGGIAHDFNNILSSILGYAELSLEDVEKGSQIDAHLRQIYLAGQRATKLVKQILTFARRSDDQVKLVAVDKVAHEALQLLRSSLPAGIEITSRIDNDALIMGDPTQVHQIFVNLCTNAAQAMEKMGGELAITLETVMLNRAQTRKHANLKTGRYVKLTVSDTGAGIPSDLIESIFEPYFTTKAPSEGTGMGLATVHGIVNHYGGDIMVDSQVGRGTAFTLFLPAAQKQAQAQPAQAQSVPTGTEAILFVDDEAAIVKMGGQMLERLGYRVTIQTSSEAALALFRRKPQSFDLVITDMSMPRINGDKLAREVLKIRPDIPVIICSGYSKELSEDYIARLGVRALAHKPLVKKDLAVTVRNVLDG